MLTQERLKEVLSYCERSGAFSRLRKPGIPVGHVGRYLQISIDGASYYAHRLAWLYVHGEFPANTVDHINGDGLDNRIANLRAASWAENQQNVGVRRDNTSGHPGVWWNAARRKWQAGIKADGRLKYLGLFASVEDAAEAYRSAKRANHTFQPEIRAA